VKNVIAYVPFLSVKHILLVDIYILIYFNWLRMITLIFCLQLIYMKIKNVNWIILIVISLDYAYDIFSRIQRIQSINKHTEYDNLILEQHILSKKNW
jgi:hypothetical protein